MLDARPFASLDDLKSRVPLHKDELRLLAEIGAFNALPNMPRGALQVERELLPADDLFTWSPAKRRGVVAAANESNVFPMNAQERLQADYRAPAC